jgi:hypothetical protein
VKQPELPTIELMTAALRPPATPTPTITREHYWALARQVKLLSWLSLARMTVEGIVAIIAGIVASSIGLIGFGLDSAVEGVASVVIIWRFPGTRVFSHSAERRARKLVVAQFFLLAPRRGGGGCVSSPLAGAGFADYCHDDRCRA